MTSTPQRTFDKNAFETGLKQLSSNISSSDVLSSLRPLEIVASGGYVSVRLEPDKGHLYLYNDADIMLSYLHNRKATQDLDFFVNEMAFGANAQSIKNELRRLIIAAAQSLNFDDHWCNDDMTAFLTLLRDPQALFLRSKQQGIILFKDANLVVYAVLWEWVLVRKLKRLQMEGQRPRAEDWNDCVTISKLLYERHGCMSVAVLQEFDHPTKEPPVLEKTLMDLRKLCRRIYGIDPFR